MDHSDTDGEAVPLPPPLVRSIAGVGFAEDSEDERLPELPLRGGVIGGPGGTAVSIMEEVGGGVVAMDLVDEDSDADTEVEVGDVVGPGAAYVELQACMFKQTTSVNEQPTLTTTRYGRSVRPPARLVIDGSDGVARFDVEYNMSLVDHVPIDDAVGCDGPQDEEEDDDDGSGDGLDGVGSIPTAEDLQFVVDDVESDMERADMEYTPESDSESQFDSESESESGSESEAEAESEPEFESEAVLDPESGQESSED